MYTLDFAVPLGRGNTDRVADLRAQLYDSDGADIGDVIDTGFVEIGTGNYHWHYEEIPDSFRGGVKFYMDGGTVGADSPDVLAICAINPEEAENLDLKLSDLLTSVNDAIATVIADLDLTTVETALIDRVIAAIGEIDIVVHPTTTVLGACKQDTHPLYKKTC